MAGFLYQRSRQGAQKPKWKLADYDINEVVGSCLNIIADPEAPPIKVLRGEGEYAVYEDPNKLFTKTDSRKLAKLRREVAEKTQTEYDETQTKATLTLMAKAKKEPWKTSWTEDEKHKMSDYKLGQEEYFRAHFNASLIRNRAVQNLLRKRLQNRDDERIAELFDLMDLVNEDAKAKAKATA